MNDYDTVIDENSNIKLVEYIRFYYKDRTYCITQPRTVEISEILKNLDFDTDNNNNNTLSNDTTKHAKNDEETVSVISKMARKRVINNRRVLYAEFDGRDVTEKIEAFAGPNADFYVSNGYPMKASWVFSETWWVSDRKKLVITTRDMNKYKFGRNDYIHMTNITNEEFNQMYEEKQNDISITSEKSDKSDKSDNPNKHETNIKKTAPPPSPQQTSDNYTQDELDRMVKDILNGCS